MPGCPLPVRSYLTEDHVREVDAEAEGVRALEFGDQAAAVVFGLGGVVVADGGPLGVPYL